MDSSFKWLTDELIEKEDINDKIEDGIKKLIEETLVEISGK